MPRRKRVDEVPVAELREVDMLRARHHAPEQGLVFRDAVADGHVPDQVPVLEERAVAGVDLDHLRLRAGDDAGGDRVHGRTVRRGDVDAAVEGEIAAAREQRAGRSTGCEDRTGVAEIAAYRVLPVEGLDRPAVRIRAAPGGGPRRR